MRNKKGLHLLLMPLDVWAETARNIGPME